jgi:hypothetical protein
METKCVHCFCKYGTNGHPMCCNCGHTQTPPTDFQLPMFHYDTLTQTSWEVHYGRDYHS